METLRSIVLLVHLVGFATIFGSWLVEVANRRVQVTRLMQWGLALSLIAGLALSAPWGTDADFNYLKIGIKLVILLVIGGLLGVLGARQKRGAQIAPAMFWAVGIMTLANAAIAVIW
ncbi:Fe-S protein [Microbacterium oryzae]|uniref:Fe-S protein n=1 Tax=Microbacterium oryzae TaxID=743009 RepID=A0A6I6E809_9MICO|nr:Fe-S protein [Microbacterium oryzae]QGU28540.1 Fe-S protein [Microbacterium oryzae]